MKKIACLFYIVLMIASLYSCKSVESLMKEGKYQEAYELAKTAEEKENIINQLTKKGKYHEAYELCSDEETKKIIMKENDYAKIINNCSSLWHLDSDREIIGIYSGVMVADYCIVVAKKKIVGDGYFQGENLLFNESGGFIGSIFDNDIIELNNEVSTDYRHRKIVDKALGTKYAGKAVSSYSDKEAVEFSVKYALLANLSNYLTKADKANETTISNLNNLIHTGMINQVEFIKK